MADPVTIALIVGAAAGVGSSVVKDKKIKQILGGISLAGLGVGGAGALGAFGGGGAATLGAATAGAPLTAAGGGAANFGAAGLAGPIGPLGVSSNFGAAGLGPLLSPSNPQLAGGLSQIAIPGAGATAAGGGSALASLGPSLQLAGTLGSTVGGLFGQQDDQLALASATAAQRPPVFPPPAFEPTALRLQEILAEEERLKRERRRLG